ncbi:SoxW family protein [Helicobacter baculiformis]|uniref:SoxW family protein n=1 Tax=Helicobacter baculiformis TaxID=427351 RepID=A0ABV7ZJ55_9HELI|nr:thioredoxin fold domain-containing protein [Helicobacter baculiformis]
MSRFFLAVLVLLSLTCFGVADDDAINEDMISSGSASSPQAIEKANNLDKQSYMGLEDVFLDTKTIAPNGKYMLLVFGKNGCSYCELLKQDIKKHNTLKDFIKANYSAYYINISYSKMHNFRVGGAHKNKEFKLPTFELASIYDVSSTPTIVFANPDGKTIYELPGYMPYKQFLAVLEFVGKGLYKGIKDDKEFTNKLRAYILKRTRELNAA